MKKETRPAAARKISAAGVVLAFVVTAMWDVVLRYFAEGKIEMLGIQNWTWVVALKPYFEKHTLLAAAGIAGMVGAFTYVIIETLAPARLSLPRYLLFIAFISAMVGIPMRISGLFPHLKTHYYDPLPITTIFTDALSGVIVAITMGIVTSLGIQI